MSTDDSTKQESMKKHYCNLLQKKNRKKVRNLGLERISDDELGHSHYTGLVH